MRRFSACIGGSGALSAAARWASTTPGKVKVNITTQDGTQCDFESPVGISLMEAIRDIASLDMDGTCDGCVQCGTCHVYLSPAWADKVTPASEREQDLLDNVLDPKDSSRLACQITLRDDCDGIEVALPKSVENQMM